MERITTKSKRKAPLYNLQRRVRARRDEPEEIPSNESQSEEGSEDEDSEEQSEEDLEQDDDESDSASEDDDDEEVDDPSAVVSQISFGALAKAQASLPNARRGNKGRATQGSDEDSESSDQPDPKTQDNNKLHLKPSHRTSKHAPTEQSSKRQVSRKREVVAVHKPVARDPRFSSAVSGRPLDEEKARRAYDFLDKYREDEMAQLRSAIKKTRDESAKEELRRALKSMQGRKQAQEQRDKERRVLEEHRRQEKELVKQGKKPFYLKKSEQKKRLLVDRFAGLKKKQVDRVIERRRKKLAARERRDAPMPAPRREMS